MLFLCITDWVIIVVWTVPILKSDQVVRANTGPCTTNYVGGMQSCTQWPCGIDDLWLRLAGFRICVQLTVVQVCSVIIGALSVVTIRALFKGRLVRVCSCLLCRHSHRILLPLFRAWLRSAWFSSLGYSFGTIAFCPLHLHRCSPWSQVCRARRGIVAILALRP